MRKRSPLVIALAVPFLLTCFPAAALAGVEPSPWHVIIENRSDEIASTSLLYNQVWENFVVTFTDATSAEYSFTRRDSLAPGQTLGWLVDLTSINQSIQSWSVAIIKGGVEPVPWRVYAFEPGTASPEDPGIAPTLSLGAGPQVAKEFFLFGFASPGVDVGRVKLANSLCDVSGGWKNPGQYVRCVSLAAEDFVTQGLLTQEEADVMVSAAAKSNVGK